jgi:hypothetical protein
MRARAIELGRDHFVRERHRAVRRVTSVRDGGIGYAGTTTRRRVTVVDLVPPAAPRRPSRATVEAPVWVCVNAHWFTGPGELSRAMLAGELRYRRERRRWTVPVRDVVGLAPELTAERRRGHLVAVAS